MKNDIKKQISKIIEISNKAYEVKFNDTEDKKYNSLKQLRDGLVILLGLYEKYEKDEDFYKSKFKPLNMLIGECEDSAFGGKYLCDFYIYYSSIVSSIKYYMDKFKQEGEIKNEN